MRAVLIMFVFAAWVVVIGAALATTLFVVGSVARRLGGRPPVGLPRRSTLGFALYAALTAAAALAVVVLVLSGGNSGEPGGPLEAAVWASLPAWSALAATAAALMSWQQRRSMAAPPAGA